METLATKTGIQSILVINQIVREDQGLYKCSMSNPFGSDSQTLKVVVQGNIIRVFGKRVLQSTHHSSFNLILKKGCVNIV